MIKNRPSISQIIFSLTFVSSLWYLQQGICEWMMVYLFFYWFWLAYVAGKFVRHPMTNKFSKSITDTNTVISLLIIFGMVLILSASFLTRVMFWFSGFYSVVSYGLLLAFLLSISGHIYIITKNIFIINHEKDKLNLILGLMFYPFGIWTIQETLKQKSVD